MIYKTIRRLLGWMLIVAVFIVVIETRPTGLDEVIFALMLIAGAVLAI